MNNMQIYLRSQQHHQRAGSDRVDGPLVRMAHEGQHHHDADAASYLRHEHCCMLSDGTSLRYSSTEDGYDSGVDTELADGREQLGWVSEDWL